MSIEDILKDMPLETDAKARLKESWTEALSDAKTAQNAKLREEMSTRYEADLEKIHEAFSAFLEKSIKPHVEELQEGVAQVDGMKAQYAEKIAKIKTSAQAHVNNRVSAMEAFIKQRLGSELAELHEDVTANRRATMAAITEKKAQLEKDRQIVLAKSARALEHVINVSVPAQLDELREDIQAARRDNFGREVFEAFSTTFRSQFFDSASEFKKLAESTAASKAEVKKVKMQAAKAVKESREKAEAESLARRKLVESVNRGRTMARLLKPLTGQSRSQMKTLLEATRTDKLETTFRKEYPRIVQESKKVPAKSRALKEHNASTVKKVQFRTGGTPTALTEDAYDPFEEELVEMRRLAGNKR